MRLGLISIVLGFFLFAGSPSDASAYIDPATGSIVLQGIIAGVCSGLVLIKVYWRKIVGIFKQAEIEPEDVSSDDRP